MRELDLLRRHTRANASLVAGRVTRLHDAMHALGERMVWAFESGAADPDADDDAAARELAAAGFTRIGADFYERRHLVARLAAGEAVEDHGVCYVCRGIENERGMKARIAAMAKVGASFRALQRRLGDVAWVYYTDRTGMGMVVPYHEPGSVLTADFDWLGYLPYRLATPEHDPERAIVWSPPTVDYGGTGVILTPSIPIYVGGVFQGACHIDVPMRVLVGDVINDSLVDEQVSFLVDREGLIVAHPTVEALLRGEHGAVARVPMTALGEELDQLDVPALITAGGTSRELTRADGPAVVVTEGIPAIGWLLVSVFPTRSLQARRAEAVHAALAALSRGDTSVRLESTSDVIGDIAVAFNETARLLAENIEAQRAFEQRLMEAEKLRVIGRLAAGIAHDFNNLLTAIGGSAHLLREGVVDDEEERELIQAIIAATDRAGALTSQLLTFARKDVVDKRVVDLALTLRESHRLLRRMVSSDVELDLDVPEDLPHVCVDPGQLAQIVLNLVVNARDALPVRGGHIHVRARKRPSGDAEIVVADDGRGMDPGALARATEPFFTTKSTGTGLGLSTVKEIVTRAGGSFRLDSTLGAGTRATVVLPATEAVSVAPPAEPHEAPRDAVIVLVDDDELVLNSTERWLRRLGYEVFACSSSQAALDLIEDPERKVSLLVSDVIMPGRSGRELAESAQRARPGLPVVFMSGYTDDAILLHGIETDTVRLVRKPFRPETLAEAVRAAL